MEEALGIASQRTPDLCVVSATFGAGEGLSLAHRLKHLPQAPLVLICAEAVDARLAGAALIAGADGVFDSATGAEKLTTMLTRVAAGEQAFPALVPDPFDELAARVDEEDRRIVAMLLLRANPDEIARVLGISARSFRVRLQMIVRRLDAVYAGDRVAPGDTGHPRPAVDHGRRQLEYAHAVSVPLRAE
jgi:DNA-binding NarL/FixJ family response regulator